MTTQNQRVFADGREVHVFVREAAAHHAHVRTDRNGGHAAAVEDVEIGLIMRAILLVQTRVVHVQRIRIFHREFAHADEARARARIVAELGLDVIHQLRQLAIRSNLGLA